MSSDLEARLRIVEDRQQVTEQLYRYCRACDRLDEALMASVFWPDATAIHGTYNGPAEGFWRGALNFLSRIEAGLHYASNPIVEIDGDTAYQEALFTAWHRVARGPLAPSRRFLDVRTTPAPVDDEEMFDGFPGHDPEKDEDAVFHGRYVNRFARRDGEWRILRHVCFTEWSHWAEASERSPVNLQGLSRRDRQDPAYWRRPHWPGEPG